MSSKWETEFDHGYIANYTTTTTRAVGPTFETGKRGTLPVPSPSDTNSVWVAPNGNDANAGTQASPKLTILSAQGALGGAKVNIQIFRNGYVGTYIEIDEGDNTSLTTGQSIQCTDGDIARINYDSGHGLSLTNGAKANGLIIHDIQTGANVSPYSQVASGGTWQNCLFTSLSSNNTLAPINYNGAASTGNLEYCILGGVHVIASGSPTLNITNCILHSGRNNDTSAITDNSPYVLAAYNSFDNGETFTFNITRSIITSTGLDYANGGINKSIFYAALIGTTATRTATFNISSSFIQSSNGLISLNSALTGAAITVNISNINSLIKTAVNVNLIDSDIVATTVPTLTNPIPSNTPPMLMDIVAAQNTIDLDTLYNFSLQAKGKQSFVLDSPLFGAGLSGVDVSPFDETTSFVSHEFQKNTKLFWTPSGYSEKHRFINNELLYDINGNAHTAYDTRRREFTFTYNEYSHNNDFRRLLRLLQDTGPMRWYPLGKGETVFIDPETGSSDAVNGVFDASTLIFTPNINSGLPMIENNWAGFWLEFNSQNYYIASNDSSTFQLENKLDETPPVSGIYNFTIPYILVRSIQNDIAGEPSRFKSFLQGSAFREFDNDQSLAFEFQGHAVTFGEIDNV